MIRKYPFPNIVPLTGLLLLLSFSACRKDSTGTNIEAPKASLEVTIRDSSGAAISGAAVALFDNYMDRDYYKNFVRDILYTDNNGRVLYEDLDPIRYYVAASKGCETNLLGLSDMGILEPNKTKSEDITLTGIGTVYLTSKTMDHYHLFLNGEDMGQQYINTLFPSGKYIFGPLKATTYTIRIVSMVGSPLDTTIVAPVPCGGSLNLNMP